MEAESKQCPVKHEARGRDPTCPSLRLALLKSGHCLFTLGKELTAWRKWAEKSRELEPAAQPAGGTHAEKSARRKKLLALPRHSYVSTGQRGKHDPYRGRNLSSYLLITATETTKSKYKQGSGNK